MTTYCRKVLTKQQTVILEALMRRRTGLRINSLVGILYSGDPNGGPTDPGRAVRMAMCNLRKFAKERGVEIVSSNPFGGAGSDTVYAIPGSQAQAALALLKECELAPEPEWSL